MMATEDRIRDEIEKLKGMRDKVCQFTLFGDDNHAAIDAQIKVLEERLDEDAIYDDEDWDQHVQESAIEALNWMDGEEETAPSEGWLPLVE